MKFIVCKLLLILSFLVTVSSCSNEQKAEKVIKNYMRNNLGDYSSYESMETTVEPFMSNALTDNKDYLESLAESSMELDKVLYRLNKNLGEEVYRYRVAYLGNSSVSDLDKFLSKCKLNFDSLSVLFLNNCAKLDSLRKLSKDYIDNYQEYQKGWLVHHKYRAANAFGGKDIYDKYYIIDTDFTEIQRSSDYESSLTEIGIIGKYIKKLSIGDVEEYMEPSRIDYWKKDFVIDDETMEKYGHR